MSHGMMRNCGLRFLRHCSWLIVTERALARSLAHSELTMWSTPLLQPTLRWTAHAAQRTTPVQAVHTSVRLNQRSERERQHIPVCVYNMRITAPAGWKRSCGADLFGWKDLLQYRRLPEQLNPLGEAQRRETEPVVEVVLLQILKQTRGIQKGRARVKEQSEWRLNVFFFCSKSYAASWCLHAQQRSAEWICRGRRDLSAPRQTL